MNIQILFMIFIKMNIHKIITPPMNNSSNITINTVNIIVNTSTNTTATATNITREKINIKN